MPNVVTHALLLCLCAAFTVCRNCSSYVVSWMQSGQYRVCLICTIRTTLIIWSLWANLRSLRECHTHRNCALLVLIDSCHIFEHVRKIYLHSYCMYVYVRTLQIHPTVCSGIWLTLTAWSSSGCSVMKTVKTCRQSWSWQRIFTGTWIWDWARSSLSLFNWRGKE